MNDFLYSSGFLRSPLGPLKFARSVPLRLGVSRVPRTCYGFCVRRAGATTPWYAQSPLGLRSGAYARR